MNGLAFKVRMVALMVGSLVGPVNGDLGTVRLQLTSDGESGSISGGLAGMTIPIEVSFTADSSGSSGSNRGVAGLVFKVITSLPLIDQMPLELSPRFVNRFRDGLAASTTVGAGFFLFPDGGVASDGPDLDSFKDTIEVVGGFQGLVPKFESGSMGRLGPHQEFAGHFSPILVASGLIKIHPSTPSGTYHMRAIVTAAIVWDQSSREAQTRSTSGVGDIFTLIVSDGPLVLGPPLDPPEGLPVTEAPGNGGGGASPSPGMGESTVGNDGVGGVDSGNVKATVDGWEVGTSLHLVSDESGDATLTIGDLDDPLRIVEVGGIDGSANITAISDPFGMLTFDVRIDAHAGSSTVVAIRDPSGAELDVIVLLDEANDLVSLRFSFIPARESVPSAKLVPGQSGFEGGVSVGGPVEVSGSGFMAGSRVTVRLGYRESELAGVDEDRLRVLRWVESAGKYMPVGIGDRGISPPTGLLGDYGVDVLNDVGWVEVVSLGTFALGIPGSDPFGDRVDASMEIPTLGSSGGGGFCGVVGGVNFLFLFLGVSTLRWGRAMGGKSGKMMAGKGMLVG